MRGRAAERDQSQGNISNQWPQEKPSKRSAISKGLVCGQMQDQQHGGVSLGQNHLATALASKTWITSRHPVITLTGKVLLLILDVVAQSLPKRGKPTAAAGDCCSWVVRWVLMILAVKRKGPSSWIPFFFPRPKSTVEAWQIARRKSYMHG